MPSNVATTLIRRQALHISTPAVKHVPLGGTTPRARAHVEPDWDAPRSGAERPRRRLCPPLGGKGSSPIILVGTEIKLALGLSRLVPWALWAGAELLAGTSSRPVRSVTAVMLSSEGEGEGKKTTRALCDEIFCHLLLTAPWTMRRGIFFFSSTGRPFSHITLAMDTMQP